MFLTIKRITRELGPRPEDPELQEVWLKRRVDLLFHRLTRTEMWLYCAWLYVTYKLLCLRDFLLEQFRRQ